MVVTLHVNLHFVVQYLCDRTKLHFVIVIGCRCCDMEPSDVTSCGARLLMTVSYIAVNYGSWTDCGTWTKLQTWDWIMDLGLDYRTGTELWNLDWIIKLGLNCRN